MCIRDSTYPRRDGQAELTGVAEIGLLHRELNPGLVTHPSTNRARCRVTSLMETNALPLSQTVISITYDVKAGPSVYIQGGRSLYAQWKIGDRKNQQVYFFHYFSHQFLLVGSLFFYKSKIFMQLQWLFYCPGSDYRLLVYWLVLLDSRYSQ